ncbi:MAG: hypothetical protein CO021_01835 [Deltaproteobacteria bacterium CG_4_9_14_0_2_um_filter_42_21]|nr:MAG: hypothetical protein CO021_01835 [Deltaproteobacteria bacterium CG_4_9_14_0_2_um_filter_42_21]
MADITPKTCISTPFKLNEESPYSVCKAGDKNNPELIVADGDYQGEPIGVSSKMSGTTPIPHVRFSKEEAEGIRTCWEIQSKHFHLDADSPVSGRYSFFYESPTMLKGYLDQMPCVANVLGDSPDDEGSRSAQIKEMVRTLMPEEHSMWGSGWIFGITGFLPHAIRAC